MLRVENLSYQIESFSLRDIHLEVSSGEYFVLLGKTGSGKTLLLECLCGLRNPGEGQVFLDGQRIDRLSPARRGIGFVPQDYALFQGRTVQANIEFPLRVKKIERTRRKNRTREVASLVGIEGLLERKVNGLSGGEKQKVALARVLAFRPRLILLDEPVSALDTESRMAVLTELRRIQRESNTTTIHVCHDLEEMGLVADRVGILGKGTILQAGTGEEVRARPRRPDVAKLLRLGNVLPGELLAPFLTKASPEIRKPGAQVLLRREKILLGGEGPRVKVARVLRRNFSLEAVLNLGSASFTAEFPIRDATHLKEGTEVIISIPEEAIWLFKE